MPQNIPARTGYCPHVPCLVRPLTVVCRVDDRLHKAGRDRNPVCAAHDWLTGRTLVARPADPPRVGIDLNVRIGRDLTYTGFGDIAGGWTAAMLPRFSTVDAFESESGVHGPAMVAGRDFDRRILYLIIDWTRLREGDAGEPGS